MKGQSFLIMAYAFLEFPNLQDYYETDIYPTKQWDIGKNGEKSKTMLTND